MVLMQIVAVYSVNYGKYKNIKCEHYTKLFHFKRGGVYLYPYSVDVITFNSITNLMHLFIKNYHNSHLKPHTLKMSVMHN
jgi:hypothetical protein